MILKLILELLGLLLLCGVFACIECIMLLQVLVINSKLVKIIGIIAMIITFFVAVLAGGSLLNFIMNSL